MQVTSLFCSVHSISGLTLPASTPRLALVERPGLRAIIGSELDDVCGELDLSRAVATLLLRGIVGTPQEEFDAAAAAEVQKIIEGRQTEAKGRLLLFVESTIQLDLDLSQTHREAHGMVVGFDLVDREVSLRDHQEAFRVIAAALALTVGSEFRTHKLSEGLYCRDGDGKRYLSYTFIGHPATLTVSTRPEALGAVAEYVERCESRTDLRGVVRLAADAATAADRFRAWSAAWTALETLITSRFKRYERIFLDRLRAANAEPSTIRYLDRASDAFADRYRLLDRFAIIASVLFQDRAETDVTTFARLKKQRDAVAHGQDVKDSDLDADGVKELQRRYLDADLRFGR